MPNSPPVIPAGPPSKQRYQLDPVPLDARNIQLGYTERFQNTPNTRHPAANYVRQDHNYGCQNLTTLQLYDWMRANAPAS